MLISLVEAFARFNTWREAKTSLEVHISLEKPGLWADVWGAVRECKGSIVEIGTDAGTLRLELREAFFDWQDEAPSSSNFASGLLAEFSNGDKVLFSVLRTDKPS